ncbi:hypothetical protein TrRE_jg10514, partial [Triparma retinervis]
MLDLYQGLMETSSMDLNVGVTCLDCASGNNILAGCVDGTVKILDGRLRSQRARYQQSVQAVSTNVRKVKMNDNQHLVAVSGGRGEVVTFDTRMTGRACHHIQANMSSPTFLHWLPNEQSETLLIGGSTSLQILQPLGDPSYAQYLQPGLGHGENITTVDVSMSGTYIAAGTDAGNVALFE